MPLLAIPAGCQKVAGGRAKRYPRFSQGKKSHPGGVPERLFCAENLASRRDAGVAAPAPGVSSRTALLNSGRPSGIPLGWPREACGPSPTPPKTAENQNTLFTRRELRFFDALASSVWCPLDNVPRGTLSQIAATGIVRVRLVQVFRRGASGIGHRVGGDRRSVF